LVPRESTASERPVSSRACHRLIYVGQGRVAPSHLEHLAPVGLAVLEGAHWLAREATVRLRVKVRVRVRVKVRVRARVRVRVRVTVTVRVRIKRRSTCTSAQKSATEPPTPK